MEKKYLETEAKANMSLERIERVDLHTKEQEKKDSKQDAIINMLDDRLTHFEITLKTVEAQLERRDKTPPPQKQEDRSQAQRGAPIQLYYGNNQPNYSMQM
jgi:hypothetical protein